MNFTIPLIFDLPLFLLVTAFPLAHSHAQPIKIIVFELCAERKNRNLWDDKLPEEFGTHMRLYDAYQKPVNNICYKYSFQINSQASYSREPQCITRQAADPYGYSKNPLNFKIKFWENHYGGGLSYDRPRFRDGDDLIWDRDWKYFNDKL